MGLSFINCLKIKQVINLLPKTYHLQKTVINSKFIIYIITTLLIWLQRYYIEVFFPKSFSSNKINLSAKVVYLTYFCIDNPAVSFL